MVVLSNQLGVMLSHCLQLLFQLAVLAHQAAVQSAIELTQQAQSNSGYYLASLKSVE